MEFAQTPNLIRCGQARYNDANNNWQNGMVWVYHVPQSTTHYYAFVLRRSNGKQFSTISSQLYPFYDLYDNEENIITTLALEPYLINDNAVFRSVKNPSYYAYDGYLVKNDNRHIGYVPLSIRDRELDPSAYDIFWQGGINYQYPYSDGVFRAKGNANHDISYRARWPRWEIEGSSNVPVSYTPKAGIYLPVDGAVGEFKVGLYDEESDDWVHVNGWTDEYYVGENVTWL